MNDHTRARLVPVALMTGVALLALGTAASGSILLPFEFSAQKADKAKKATSTTAKSKSKAKPKAKAEARASARPGSSKAAPKQVSPPPRRPAAVAAASPSVPMPPDRPAPRARTAAAVPMPPTQSDAQPPSDVSGAAAAGRFLAAAVPSLITPTLASTSEFAVRTPQAPTSALSYAPAAAPSRNDVELVKEAINLAERGRIDAATERGSDIRDTAARKLVEWTILRSDNGASFARYAAFLQANPTWPSAGMLQRRAEARIWQEKRDAATVMRFFAARAPLGPIGKLALARALLETGDRAGAQRLLRDVWREDALSSGMEDQVIEDYGSLLTRADHVARFQARLYDDDMEAAARAGQRLGSGEVALVKARRAVNAKAKNAGALLDAVPASLHNDPAYLLTRIQWLRRSDRTDEATRLLLAAPHDPRAIQDPDEWWIERRIHVRRLLDEGKFQLAYRVARDAAEPTGKEGLRVDQPFTAGWIALRYLNDPRTASQHFARIGKVTDHATSLARMDYWLGRCAEAAGQTATARRHYEAASKHSAAYYGQLARARLGIEEITVRKPPALSPNERAALRSAELVRAVDLLYATGNRDLVTTFAADLERVGDIGALKMIGEIAASNNDPRAMLYMGRDAIARGLHFDAYAFPTAGLPKYSSIGPEAKRHLVYSIARQESAFSPRVVSSARAMGYMQVTPAAGQTIARKYGVKFDVKRLLNDPVYNMQFGAAEIGSLVQEYGGNHVLAFVAYNAGRGRARDWIERYGDPRDPKVDVVDWVERIPFSETRNYVQRVMENMQVYRAHFESSRALTIEADMRGVLR